jgi:predicted RNA-binding protein (virulence factor B family)
MKYPEHDKLTKVVDESQAIGEFLDFGLPRAGHYLG